MGKTRFPGERGKKIFHAPSAILFDLKALEGIRVLGESHHVLPADLYREPPFLEKIEGLGNRSQVDFRRVIDQKRIQASRLLRIQVDDLGRLLAIEIQLLQVDGPDVGGTDGL